jgi:hypothetical protein
MSSRISVVIVLVSLMILGSLTDSLAWGSKGHRIIGLLAQELLLPETSAHIEMIMGSADLATFGLYLDDNKDRLEQQIPGSRAWHYDNIPSCGRKPHSEYCPNVWCASRQSARHQGILADAHAPNTGLIRRRDLVARLVCLKSPSMAGACRVTGRYDATNRWDLERDFRNGRLCFLRLSGGSARFGSTVHRLGSES